MSLITKHRRGQSTISQITTFFPLQAITGWDRCGGSFSKSWRIRHRKNFFPLTFVSCCFSLPFPFVYFGLIHILCHLHLLMKLGEKEIATLSRFHEAAFLRILFIFSIFFRIMNFLWFESIKLVMVCIRAILLAYADIDPSWMLRRVFQFKCNETRESWHRTTEACHAIQDREKGEGVVSRLRTVREIENSPLGLFLNIDRLLLCRMRSFVSSLQPVQRWSELVLHSHRLNLSQKKKKKWQGVGVSFS